MMPTATPAMPWNTSQPQPSSRLRTPPTSASTPSSREYTPKNTMIVTSVAPVKNIASRPKTIARTPSTRTSHHTVVASLRTSGGAAPGTTGEVMRALRSLRRPVTRTLHRRGTPAPGFGAHDTVLARARPTPPRAASSYPRAELVRCTLRARHGRTSRRPGVAHPAAVATGLLVAEGGVEGRLGQVPQQRADVPDRLGGAVQAVHPGVLPLDRDRAVVADRGERAEGVLPRDVAVTGRDEVPAAARVPPRQVRAEDARAARRRADPGVLAVDVVDPVGEVGDERDRVHALPRHVRGVPVEPERLAVVDRLERAHARPVVVGDLAGVHLVREPHALGVEHVEDRVPPVREVLVALVDDRLRHRREHRDVGPDLRAREPDDDVDAQLARDPRRPLHVLGGALPHALGVAV